jgi:hypothetical protein
MLPNFSSIIKHTGTCGIETPPYPQLYAYIFIFNQISLLFHLFSLNVTCSRHDIPEKLLSWELNKNHSLTLFSFI